MNALYPVTIVYDRYLGTYSGALWTAWNEYPENLPEGYDAGDNTCSDFWAEYTGLVGKGGTPSEAVNDLVAKVAALQPKPRRST